MTEVHLEFLLDIEYFIIKLLKTLVYVLFETCWHGPSDTDVATDPINSPIAPIDRLAKQGVWFDQTLIIAIHSCCK